MSFSSAQLRAPIFFALFVAGAFTSCGGTPTYLTTESTTPWGPCVHLDFPYSARICPDTMLINAFMPSQVTAETLVVHTSDGRNLRFALPNRTDAIFLTRSALETFLLRHYDATGNKEGADEVRGHISRRSP